MTETIRIYNFVACIFKCVDIKLVKSIVYSKEIEANLLECHQLIGSCCFLLDTSTFTVIKRPMSQILLWLQLLPYFLE